MSTILDSDRDFAAQLPHQLIVPASAGSGKTTELTRQLIMLLLSREIPQSDFGNILAVTFTNNAALDMKKRVLATLKDVYFAASKKDEETLKKILPSQEREIRARAGALVEELLERYAEFHVQTIDSFLARVFKSSALEFGYSPDFVIRLSSDALIDQAFSEVIRDDRATEGLIELFEELVDLVLEAGGPDGRYIWNPYEELSREVKLLYQKLVQYAVPVNVRDRSQEIRERGAELVTGVLALAERIEAAGLTASSGFTKYAGEAQRGSIERLMELQVPERPVVKGKKAPPGYDEFLANEESSLKELRRLRSRLKGLRARQHYLPYARGLAALQEALERVRRVRKEIDIGEIGRRLSSYLEQEVVPELYFKLGEEIRHYLIDEFQDTSPVQWHVLQPLVANTLSEGGSLFVVGDLKQSIYSFRGADWRIMDQLMKHNMFPMAGEPDIRPLETNFRSGGRILEFTRTVFQEIVPSVVTGGAADASGLATYTERPKDELRDLGHVEMVRLERDDEARPEREALLEIVEDCLRRGYRKRDIAVLSPTNDAVIAVSAWLNERSIEFISHSSLDIRTRKVTAEIIALLRFLDSPIDELSFASVLLGDLFRGVLSASGRSAVAEEVDAFLVAELAGRSTRRPLYTLFRERFDAVWAELFEQLFARVGYLPLYDLVSEICTTFQAFQVMGGEEATLAKLLEVAQQFEETGMNTIRDFLQYADERSEDADWTMALPEDADAVRIMTVHKAKGLGFRVVVALFYDSRPRPDAVGLREEEGGLELIHLTNDLKETDDLAEWYAGKRQDEEVDRLNKLYVALTRAKEELYVISIRRETKGQPSELLPQKGYEKLKRPAKVRAGDERRTRTVGQHHQRTWKSAEPTAYAKIGKAETARGDFIHAILASLETVGGDLRTQLDEAAERCAVLTRETLPSGFVPDLEETRDRLVRFLEHADVHPLFEARPSRRILNEQEFVDGEGRLVRMDRVVIDPDHVTVVDFKTGSEKPEYTDQVRAYMDILAQVFPGKTIRGLLAYVDRLTLMRIGEEGTDSA